MPRLWIAACRMVGVLTIATFVMAAFTGFPNVAARRIATVSDLAPTEAIVVLGASANPDGSLTHASLSRTLHGIMLFRQAFAPRIVFLGTSAEASARAKLAEELGIEPRFIVIEDEEPTTRDEGARMRVVLGERLAVRSVVLVTDALHMRRARMLFRRAGFNVRMAPTDSGMLTTRRPEERLRLARAVGLELVPLIYLRLFGYR